MTQGINLQSVSTATPVANQQNIFQKAKTKAIEFKDSFEKSNDNTKAKVNTALAGGSIAGTILTMLGARVSEKTVRNTKKGAEEGAKKAAEGAKNVIKKQNTPLKWLGALIAIASSAGIIALNFKSKDSQEGMTATTVAEPAAQEAQAEQAQTTADTQVTQPVTEETKKEEIEQPTQTPVAEQVEAK